MGFILRKIWRSLFGSQAKTSYRRSSTAAVAVESPIKKMALCETAVRQLIETFPKARVAHVIDGDTVIVERVWCRTKIRLDSIDCPEDGQHWGDTAAYGLIKLIGGKRIHLEEHGLDSRGRTLATIYVRSPTGNDWLNVNERMVTLGHAWVMRRYYDHLPSDRQARLNRLEQWARTRRVGLWRNENPLPPWQWRRNRQ